MATVIPTLSQTNVIIEDTELTTLIDYLDSIVTGFREGWIYRVRIGTDAEGVKFKLNEGTWSPGVQTRREL